MPVSGFLVVDKPVGWTSFDVDKKIRALSGTRKVGHCGTLDPFASGVLPICVGSATRMIPYLDDAVKAYQCRMRFGERTDTQDVEGNVTASSSIGPADFVIYSENNYALIRSCMKSFIGTIMQKPPMYSAIKVDGKPLYYYARKGETKERKPREITIYSLDIIDIFADDNVLYADIVVVCSRGTYIRTLCDDIGEKLGLYAYAKSLRRICSGSYKIEDAVTLDQLTCAAREGNLSSLMQSEDKTLRHLPTIDLDVATAKKIQNGRMVGVEELMPNVDDGDLFRGMCEGRLIALLFLGDHKGRQVWRIKRVFERA